MRTLGIQTLQKSPDVLDQALESCDSLLITRHGEPIGMATAFTDSLLDLGLKKWLVLRAFQTGDLSLGQIAQAFNQSREASMQMLSRLGIAIADYDLAEDLNTIDQLGCS